MKGKHILLLLSLICSCAPSRLVPYDYSIEENNLETYIELENITISMMNLAVENDHYVFGVGIRNDSNEPVSIDSERILKFANNSSYQEESSNLSNQGFDLVLTPQQVTQLFETKRNDAKSAGILLFLMGTAIGALDAVLDAKDNSKEYWTKSDQRRSLTRDITTGVGMLTSEVLSESAFQEADRSEMELQYLPEEFFHKTVIAEGEEYYGKIFFKISEDFHKYHRVAWRLQDIRILFDFRLATGKERRFLKSQVY